MDCNDDRFYRHKVASMAIGPVYALRRRLNIAFPSYCDAGSYLKNKPFLFQQMTSYRLVTDYLDSVCLETKLCDQCPLYYFF